MNERVKRMKKGIVKATCVAVILTAFTGYSSVFADTNEELRQKQEELKKKNEKAQENFTELGDEIINELKGNNQFLEEREELFQKMIDGEISESEVQSKCNNAGTLTYIKKGQLGDRTVIRVYVWGCKDGGRDTQIWAVKGGEHLQVKDYEVEMAVTGLFRVFEWFIDDYPSMAKENAFRRNEEDVLRKYYDNMDDIGVYVKQKIGKKVYTYYKKVSNNQVEYIDAYLITSYDTNFTSDQVINMNNAKIAFKKSSRYEKMNRGYSTQFPAVAIKGKPFKLSMIKENTYCYNDKEFVYSITIEGDNNYSKVVVPESTVFNGVPHTWIPEFDGVFKIVLRNETENAIMSERKVFVRKNIGEGNDYLGINNMSVTGSEDDVNISVGVKNYNSGDNESQVALRVGEESVWSKHLKKYNNPYDINLIDNKTINFNSKTTTSGNITFKMGSGNYFFDALVKKKKSIEYEDVARRYYNKNNGYESLFYLDEPIESPIDETSVPYAFRKMRYDWKYPVKNQDGSDSERVPIIIQRNEMKYSFEIKTFSNENITGNYEYAFLLWDARGKRVIKNYSDEMSFEYYFRDPGKYKVFFRVREKYKKGQEYLTNAYVEEFTRDITVEFKDNYEIKINRVKIRKHNPLGEGRLFDNSDSDNNEIINTNNVSEVLTLKSHSKNSIFIDASYWIRDTNMPDLNQDEKQRLMYKVYAIHDGAWELVTPYTASAVIPFYPRSTGDYKLLVLVKDSISGSEEAKMIVNAIAED